ncbi:MAG: GNAT family N-acetyltransferase [Clostridiales Family XIII bacterium]|jgi:ribosomal protein S18 acetylase RimI-like enzyme|nr:GNAT family N-acetyltransferase [Clostridiales Family XIII bacterium]
MIQIQETADYRPLIPFFIENELEFEEGEEYGEDEIVKCWRADASDEPGASDTMDVSDVPDAQDASNSSDTPDAPPPDSRLVGACVLAERGGELICDGIAVSPSYRKGNLGKTLLNLLIKEAKSKDADKVFLVARAPGFFAKAGFTPVPREEAPDFFECFTCPQYGKTCHPEVMRLDI